MAIETSKLPPQDLDAERSVLGAVMLFDDVFDAVAEIVKPQMFYLDAHQIIFASMERIRHAGSKIDALTIANDLTCRDEFESIGGEDYLVKVLNSVVHSAHAAFHADIVKAKYMQRQVIYACMTTMAKAYQDRVDAQELASSVVNEFSGVVEQSVAGNGRWYREIALNSLDRHYSEEPPGISSGFPDLDAKIGGLRPGCLYVWAGRPGMGKTALISNVSEHVAKNCGPVAFFSLEMSDEILFDRHTVGRLNTSLTHLRAFAQNHHEEIRDAVYQLSELPIFVNSNPCQSGGSIASQCHQIKRKHGLSLVMIDYLQLVQPDDKRAPRAQQVGLLSRGFKALSKTLGVPVILLSQLNRECEKRNEKKPTLSDLRDSGEIEQDADVVTFIYRPAVYFPDKHKESEAELIIPKNRFGSVGSVNLLWDGPSMTFKSFEDDVVGFDSIDMAF